MDAILEMLNRGVEQLPPLLQRYQLVESIGEHRLHPTNRHAVAAVCPERSQIVP